MKEIKLANGKGVVIVDDEWFPLLSQWKWHLTCKGYAERSVRPGYGVMMHRIVNMTPQGLWTDHINGNKHDNRIENLRGATQAENKRNKALGLTNKSGVKGVFLAKHVGKWVAQMWVDGKKRHLGCFDNLSLAQEFMELAREMVHGKFANHGKFTA